MAAIISAIIFDMDGVLIESLDSKTEAFRRLFEEYPDKLDEIVRYHCTNQGVSRFTKIPWIFEHILHQDLDEGLKQSLFMKFADYVREAMEEVCLVPGCVEFLDYYSGIVPCAVVSAAPEEEAEDILDKRGIAHHFSMILGSPGGKAGNIMKFLDHQVINPDSAVMIGDSLSDYQAAREVGCHFIGRVPPGGEDLFTGKPGVTCLIRDLYELKSALSGKI